MADAHDSAVVLIINCGVSDPMRLFDKIKIFSCKDTDRDVESDLKSHQLKNDKDESSSNLHPKTEDETPLLVVTSTENRPSDGIYCSYCEMKLAAYSENNDNLEPSFEILFKQGAVAVPNFGWFCSQECAHKYESEFDIRFERDDSGMINYYPDS